MKDARTPAAETPAAAMAAVSGIDNYQADSYFIVDEKGSIFRDIRRGKQ